VSPGVGAFASGRRVSGSLSPTVTAIETVVVATATSSSNTITIAGPVAATDRIVVLVSKDTTSATPSPSGLGATWATDVVNNSLRDHYVFSATGITAGGVITVAGLSTTETDLTAWVLHSTTSAQVRFVNGDATSATPALGVVQSTSSGTANGGAFVLASAISSGGVLDFPETTTTTPSTGWTTVRSSSVSGDLRRRVIVRGVTTDTSITAACKSTVVASLAVLRAAYWDDVNP